ncbi:MAG: rRNA maturation RNase YbeY [Candidatus Omnitrophica bacterium]|nr:rRNA maturation RNase YbeY [Candidatus Omnitrophota bacterium]
MKISIVNRQNKLSINKQRIRELVSQAIELLNLKKKHSITIVYSDNEFIRNLNRQYLNKNEPTDVLCFEVSRDSADIVISSEKAQENARIFKTKSDYEIDLYLIHALLHLAGYKDKTQREKRTMQRREKELLRCLSIKVKPSS